MFSQTVFANCGRGRALYNAIWYSNSILQSPIVNAMYTHLTEEYLHELLLYR